MPTSDRVDPDGFDPVTVTISTNVDQRRHLMTDQDWINLGQYVADAAEQTRAARPGQNLTHALQTGAQIVITGPAGGGGPASAGPPGSEGGGPASAGPPTLREE